MYRTYSGGECIVLTLLAIVPLILRITTSAGEVEKLESNNGGT
mgnify:CR=1 FL=1